MRCGVRWLVVGLASMAGFPVAASAGAPPWSQPVDVATEAPSGSVGIDAKGDVTVVWSTAAPRAAFVGTGRATSDAFRQPVKLGPGLLPELAVAESGEALVTWSEPEPACTPSTVVCRERGLVKARAAGQRDFGPAKTLTDRAIGRPTLAMNQSGEAVLAWSTAEGAVLALLRFANGRFGNTVVLARGGGPGLPPRPAVAIGENGAAVVAWGSLSGRSEPLLASYRPPGGSFGPLEDASDGIPAFSPVAAVSARGTATLGFSTTGGAFVLADRSPTGRFKVVDDMGGAGGAVGAGFSQDLRGNQLVYWVDQTGFSLPPAFQARAAFRDVGGDWSRAVSILPPNSFPTLELDRLGNAHALWWTDPFAGQRVMGGTLTRFGILENTQQLTTISGVVTDIEVNRAGAVAALISEFRDRTSPTGGAAIRLVTRPADRSAAGVSVSAALEQKRVTVTAQCDEACRVRATLARVSKSAAVPSSRTAVTLRAGRRGSLRLKLTPHARARLRRGARIGLVVRVVDAAGNTRTLRRRLAR